MNEHDEMRMTPEDEALDRYLLSLQQFAPRAGFEDRVLARVVRRAPALVKVRSRATSFVTPRRVWWVTGVTAASSAAWTVALANWLTPAKLQGIGAWLNTDVIPPLWTSALQGTATAVQAVIAFVLAAYGSFGNAIFGATALAMIAPVLSAWGLYLTMKQTSRKRIPAYAAR